MTKRIFSSQPYLVGSKVTKSTAAVIPKKIVNLFGINTNTVFLIKTNKARREIIIQIIDNKKLKPKLSEDKDALQPYPQTISLDH
jgi:hypothetical protein